MGRDVAGSSPSSVIDGDAEHDVLDVKSLNVEDAKNDGETSEVEETQETKSSSPVKSGLEVTLVEDVETKHVVQNLHSVTTDQHAFVSPELRNKSPSINNLHSPRSSKKSLSNSSASRKHLNDEDDCSTTSSTTASGRTARTTTTQPVAPKFSVTERLEKRKEFYSKVEEKRKALEAEKREYEARNKEEQQAAIKQLRKTMVYKANPVPNFYYEGPPPKKEIKKVPTTRAVSPKLGRRKSCGDAVSEEKVAYARAPRQSLGSRDYNPKRPSQTPKKKGVAIDQSSKSSLKKNPPKQLVKEESSSTKEPTVDTVPEPEPEPEPVAEDITEQKKVNLSCQS